MLLTTLGYSFRPRAQDKDGTCREAAETFIIISFVMRFAALLASGSDENSAGTGGLACGTGMQATKDRCCHQAGPVFQLPSHLRELG